MPGNEVDLDMVDFNTHSLAGVYVERLEGMCVFISILTPLRECMDWKPADLADFRFQYSLPCGSV